MADLFKLLKKTNPNLNITLDPNTNTVKVHNSEEDIKKEKNSEKKKEKNSEKKKEKNSDNFKNKLGKKLKEIGCNNNYIRMILRWDEEKIKKEFSHILK
jgi:hypothetical protein